MTLSVDDVAVEAMSHPILARELVDEASLHRASDYAMTLLRDDMPQSLVVPALPVLPLFELCVCQVKDRSRLFHELPALLKEVDRHRHHLLPHGGILGLGSER